MILIMRPESSGLFQASQSGERQILPQYQRGAMETLARSCVTGLKSVMLSLTRRNLSHLQYGTSDEDKYQKKLKFHYRARLPVGDYQWKMSNPKPSFSEFISGVRLSFESLPYQLVCTEEIRAFFVCVVVGLQYTVIHNMNMVCVHAHILCQGGVCPPSPSPFCPVFRRPRVPRVYFQLFFLEFSCGFHLSCFG